MRLGKFTTLCAVPLLAALTLLIGGCGDDKSAAPLHVYITGHTTDGARGRSLTDAARLALEEAKGDVGETPVKLFSLDDGGDPRRAAANARRALSDGRSRALLQLDARWTVRSSVVSRGGLLHVAPLDGGRSGDTPSISIVPEDHLLGAAMAEAAHYAGVRKGKIRAPAGDREFALGAIERAQELGLDLTFVVGERAIEGDGVVVAAADQDSPRQPQPADFLVAPWLAVDEYGKAGKSFFKSYEERYDRRPDPYAIYAYDAMGLILEAIKRVQDDVGSPPTRDQMLEAAYETKARVGPAGRYDILRSGNSTLNLFGLYRKGEFERIIEIG